MKKELKKTRAVPFQLCPKCNGEGVVVRLAIDSTAKYSNVTCDVCGGAKVIPMCAL